MSDDLRTRIAQVLYGDGDEIMWNRSVELADMLIWELGLQRQDRTFATLDGHTVDMHRYLSNWRQGDADGHV